MDRQMIENERLRETRNMNDTQKCMDCYRYYNKTKVTGCEICSVLQFPEKYLCDLLRFKKSGFDCGAYRPKLQLISGKTKADTQSESRVDSYDSQRQKWIRSYLAQQQKQNPDQVQFNLKYHLVLITHERSKVFSGKYFNSFSGIFENSIKSLNDIAIALMWVSSDHIHLYLNSSPDFSVDEIGQKILAHSEPVIYMKHPELKATTHPLWESSYFVETFG